MKALFIASFVGAIAIAGAPASASAGSAVSAKPAPAPAARPAAKAAGEARYCGNITFTGSRIARRLCKTKAEWLDQGVELAPKE